MRFLYYCAVAVQYGSQVSLGLIFAYVELYYLLQMGFLNWLLNPLVHLQVIWSVISAPISWVFILGTILGYIGHRVTAAELGIPLKKVEEQQSAVSPTVTLRQTEKQLQPEPVSTATGAETNRHRILVGSFTASPSGYDDHMQVVEFEGLQLAKVEYELPSTEPEFSGSSTGIETLYRMADGRLVVHIERNGGCFSVWGDGRLVQVSETDLWPDSRFELLGREAGFARPLTIDEALRMGSSFQEK